MTEKILIFPAGMPRSIEFLARCRQEGRQVIGASSLDFDSCRERYDEWRYLPYVVSDQFQARLTQLVAEDQITHIFSPNLVVWDYLNTNLANFAPSVRLVNASPVSAEIEPYNAAIARAQDVETMALSVAHDSKTKPALSTQLRAAIFKYVDTIPGMCDYDKMIALTEVMRSAPLGDVVEIGSWWGKSAVLLHLLATHYETGNLLCIDPWQDINLLQKDASALVDKTASSIDANQALSIFEMNMLPIADNRCNYIRDTSQMAVKKYAGSKTVFTNAFGSTNYLGKISLLHIDGNHDYEAVMIDIESWGGYVQPGGWIIFDDYVWPFGDGPRRVADKFCTEQVLKIACAFAMGSAMFIKLAD